MRNNRLQLTFFIALSVAVAALVFFIFLPFMTPLAVAAALAVVLWPVRNLFLRLFRGNKVLAALVTVVIALVLILIPLSIVGYEIFKESAGLYAQASAGTLPSTEEIAHAIENPVQRYFPTFTLDLKPGAENVFKWFIDHLGTIFSSTLQTALEFFVAVLAFFYFLKDGEKFRKKILELSPLPDDDDSVILDKLVATINSVFLGTLLVAVIQGVLSGLGFAFFGIPNSTLWGSLAAICALIPGFGTSLVLIPGVIYLFASGDVVNGLGLLIWSVTAVGLIDNLLRPYLVGRGVHIHPLLVLIAVVGGIDLFGALGFLIGPVVLSLMFALMDLYLAIYGGRRPKPLAKKRSR